MRCALPMLLACAALAAADWNPDLVLQRAAIKMRVEAAGLPNYTCVQTTTRDFYTVKSAPVKHSCESVLEQRQHPEPATTPHLAVTDRLRLDVTMTERGEIYSWAGASKFEDAGIDAVVHQGPIGSGTFGGFLAIILGQDLKTFHYQGPVRVNGRDLLEYQFRVAREASHYKVRATDSWVYTGYSGSIQIDPETFQAAWFNLETDILPAETNSCQTITTMDLKPTRIGDGDFLLPSLSKQRFISAIGDETENTTTLAGCREYRGESTITFFAEPDAAAAGSKGGSAATRTVPARRPFKFELLGNIALDTAAGGDPITGRLATPLRDEAGKVIAPAHAAVEGRVVRVEIVHTRHAAIVVLKLKSIEIGGVKVPIEADRDWRTTLAGARQIQVLIPEAWEGHAGVFRLSGDHPVMKKGTISDWMTQ